MHPVLADVDTVLLDCDGVLWRGAAVLPRIGETLHALRGRLGKQVIFVSNNSTLSRERYREKFDSLGLHHVTADDIVSSAFAAALYFMQQRGWDKERDVVYVIGEQGITDELDSVGIKWTGGKIRKEIKADEGFIAKSEFATLADSLNGSVKAVLMGFDAHICYRKLAMAHLYIQRQGCTFVATNTDLTYPADAGVILPGTGSLVASLEASTGVKALVMGKPHQAILHALVQNKQLDPARTLMVGDRLDTDIAFGREGGLRTLLVMSGVTTQDELEASALQPDFVLPSLSALLLE